MVLTPIFEMGCLRHNDLTLIEIPPILIRTPDLKKAKVQPPLLSFEATVLCYSSYNFPQSASIDTMGNTER